MESVSLFNKHGEDLRVTLVQAIAEHQGVQFEDSDALQKFFNGGQVKGVDAQQILAILKTVCTVMTNVVCPIVNNV